MTLAIIKAIAQIFGMFAVGGLARRLRYIRDQDLDPWSKLVVDFLMPCLVFHTIVRNFDVERIGELWLLPFLGFGIMAVGAVMGFALRRGVKSQDSDLIKTFHHFCAINNFGFIPMIIVQSLWGDAALALLFVMNLGSSIAFWTIGVLLLGETHIRAALKNLLSPTLTALLLALVLSLSGLKALVPQLLLDICAATGAAAIPVMLILIGATLLGDFSLGQTRDLLYLSLARLVLVPLAAVLILRQLPLAQDVFNVAVVVALMPVAVSSTLLTRRYGGSSVYAAQAAVVTTVISLITVPVALSLLQQIHWLNSGG